MQVNHIQRLLCVSSTMKIVICALLFTLTIFLNSVQSVKQPPRRNQPPTRNVLKYSGFHRAWLLNGEGYGIEYAGSILMFRQLEVCRRIPYCRQRRRQLKLGPQFPPYPKEPKLIPPDLQEGDILYRKGEPFGRVGENRMILEIHESTPGELCPVDPADGDTLVLSGQWIPNPCYGIPLQSSCGTGSYGR